MAEFVYHDCPVARITLRLDPGETCRHCKGEISEFECGIVDSLNECDLLDKLKEIDNSDIEVTAWEAGFLESVLYHYQGVLSTKQRKVAESMVERYLED